MAAVMLACAFSLSAMVPPATLTTLSVSELSAPTHNAFGSDSTGTRIWDAGRVLSTLLSQRDLSGQRVLECGSGTGIGGLTAAAAGAKSVLLTDGASATLSLLEENVASNGLADRVSACRLRWGHEDEMDVAAAKGPFDLVVGSDLLYAPESFPDLLETLTALCTPGHTEVLLTYPTRFTEGIFLQMATGEFDFEQLEAEEEVEPSLWASRLVLRSD